MDKSNKHQKLSGIWKLSMDPDNRGKEEQWFKFGPVDTAKDAPVPGIIQEVFPGCHGVAWYWHKFSPRIMSASCERILIRFGAVDYYADVWLNGTFLGSHEDGETPFVFDVTDVIKTEEENLLAVRVINPVEEPIDGIVLNETPHANKKGKNYMPGSSFNHGGIIQDVELACVPAVRIIDVFARLNIDAGQINLTVSVQNDFGSVLRGELISKASPSGGGEMLADGRLSADFKPGITEHELILTIFQPRLWSVDDPYLYRVTVTLNAGNGEAVLFTHEFSIRCGFRDFRVKNGYFYLNGKRIFIRSTHTGNHFPVGIHMTRDPDLLRRDLIYAKASGFNMVRFISGVAHPEQLDFCDEIGLMVYEEAYAGWCLEDSPKMAERYDRSVFGMVKRDRNHPSIVIWGLLNETVDGPVFRHACSCLPKLRELDDTRLVLLGSGRWDGQFSVGSVSNPGSMEWEYAWGGEGKDALASAFARRDYLAHGSGGYIEAAGDAHVYPIVPQTKHMNELIRKLGHNTKPVFLSEYGIGSLMNVIDEYRRYQQVGARLDLEDSSLIGEMVNKLERDWKQFGMDGVYPFPEDMLRDSQRMNARQRLLGFDLIRSNPNICGYNLTGMLDHAITGEGLWTFWRQWKPGIVDALTDGWAPLRWCLFVEPMHGYSGRTLKVEAVLANEDVLKPGQYPVCFRILGPTGVVWEKCTNVSIPEPATCGEGPLAIPVLCEEVLLNDKAGIYEFAASMLRGGSPAGGRLKFYVSDSADFPKVKATVTLWGIDGRVEAWLKSRGINCIKFGETPTGNHREIILVGDISKITSGIDDWKELMRRAIRGSTVVFLSPLAFKRGDDAVGWLPLINKGRCYEFHDWLYHKECVAKPHPIFDGLQCKGIMDWDYYGDVIPHYLFDGQDTPDEVIAAAFATGYCCPGGYASGVLVGSYGFGSGRFIINTLRILENISLHPAADRLLLNIIGYAQQYVNAPLAQLPPDFDIKVAALGYK
ncbi:MAG: hypothetical protein GX094_04880 [Clostridiales bacterium]|nr:hypothetical protein [Clostridiales bacterium]